MQLNNLKNGYRRDGWIALPKDEDSYSDGMVVFEQLKGDKMIIQSPVRFHFQLLRDLDEPIFTQDPFVIAAMVMDYADVAIRKINAERNCSDVLLPHLVHFHIRPSNPTPELREIFDPTGTLTRTIMSVEAVLHAHPHLKL